MSGLVTHLHPIFGYLALTCGPSVKIALTLLAYKYVDPISPYNKHAIHSQYPHNIAPKTEYINKKYSDIEHFLQSPTLHRYSIRHY